VFNYKDRAFKPVDQVDHMVFHVSFNGNLILKDSDDARDQDDYWDNKLRLNKSLLDLMNQEVKNTFGKDPLDGNERAQKKSLRNKFNY
jgi:hypothetical protein